MLTSSVCYAGIINTLPQIPSYYKTHRLKVNTRFFASIDWQQGNNETLDLKTGGYLTLQQVV